MDPLSDVLALLKPRSYRSGGFDVGDHLAVKFPKHPGVKCYAVISGQCWLSVEGVAEPARLTAGDCFLLPRGLPFSLSTDLNLTPVDFFTLLKERAPSVRTAPSGDAGNCFLAGGHFALTGGHADILLGGLPPIVHIRKDSDKAAMRWSIERMMEELRDPRPGGALVAQQLAYLLLVQSLRLHLEEGLHGGVGWLFALADKQMNAAITAIHADPAHRWTLHELAGCSGMSRSIFAVKFKATVGSSPMEYLTRWRMLLASDRMTSSDDPIAAIALSLGYESESAFSKAFRRVLGSSPRQHRRRQHAFSPLNAEHMAAPVEALEPVSV